MARLNRRQIIIIGITVVVVFYGAYNLLLVGKDKKDVAKSYPAETNDYMSSVARDLMKNPLKLADAYIVERAEAEWGKNPFWGKGSYKEWVAKDDVQNKNNSAAKIIYSGYIDVGKKKMAVINGLEYSVGETLEIGGYILKRITAAKVVIGSKNKGNDFEIFIQE